MVVEEVVVELFPKEGNGFHALDGFGLFQSFGVGNPDGGSGPGCPGNPEFGRMGGCGTPPPVIP